MGNDLEVRQASNEVVYRPKYPAAQRVKRETITFRYAQIIFRNFAGKPTPFNPEGGERGFSILLDEELAREMQVRGMNVKPLNKRDPDDEQMYHLPISVSYKIRPPRVYMVTGDGDRMPLRKTMLPEEILNQLDSLDLAESHMVIAVSNYDVRGTKGKKAYLQSFFGHVELDELEQEYSTVEDMIEVDGEQFKDIDIIEGEIVDD